MNRRKSAFSLIEISVILIAIALLLTMVFSSLDVLNAAKLNNARNLTKTSIAKDTPGMILWLDSTSVKSFDDEYIADGTEITNWNDLNISDKDSYVASSPATKRPLYDEDAINKLPGVRFDGTDDYMQITDFSSNAHMTLFIVGKFTDADFFIEHSQVVGSNNGFCFWGQGTCLITRSAVNGIFTKATNWFGSNSAIAVLKYDGAEFKSKLNNEAYDTVAAVLVNHIVIDTLNIGSRNGTGVFSDGSFGEIIMYNRALSNDEVDDIFEYLKSKWGIEY
jgi:hypothetical protein